MSVHIERGPEVAVYDLTVEGTHCYYAGGVLVHNCSTPTQQAAALRVMTEGVVGECALPPGVRIMAAANPEDQAAGGWTLAPPMANRLVHLEFDAPTAEAWGHWLVGDGRDDSSVPVVLSDDAWNRAWAATRASYSGFIQRFPGKLLEVPETDAQRGRAWPSPRSHELAARALAGAKALGASDGVGLRLLQGAVGEGVAAEILNYFRELDLPDPEEILAGRAKVPQKRPDQTYASLAGVCTVALIPHKDRNERITRAFEVALDVAAKSADVAASCLRAACDEKVLGPVFRDSRCSQRILAVLSKGPLKELSGWLRA